MSLQNPHLFVTLNRILQTYDNKTLCWVLFYNQYYLNFEVFYKNRDIKEENLGQSMGDWGSWTREEKTPVWWHALLRNRKHNISIVVSVTMKQLYRDYLRW